MEWGPESDRENKGRGGPLCATGREEEEEELDRFERGGFGRGKRYTKVVRRASEDGFWLGLQPPECKKVERKEIRGRLYGGQAPQEG